MLSLLTFRSMVKNLFLFRKNNSWNFSYRIRAELVGYFSSSGSFLLWEENVPLLRFDSGNQAKGLLLHLLYLRRMLKEQLPIRMLFKELLQQIILKQLIKRIRMLRVLLFQLPYPRN